MGKKEEGRRKKKCMQKGVQMRKDCFDLSKDSLEHSNNILYLKTCEVDSKENQLNNQKLNSSINQSHYDRDEFTIEISNNATSTVVPTENKENVWTALRKLKEDGLNDKKPSQKENNSFASETIGIDDM